MLTDYGRVARLCYHAVLNSMFFFIRYFLEVITNYFIATSSISSIRKMLIILGFTNCPLRAQIAYRVLNFKHAFNHDLVKEVIFLFFSFSSEWLRQPPCKPKDAQHRNQMTEFKPNYYSFQ